MTMCDHPPQVFSPTFDGIVDDKCRGIHKWRLLPFSRVTELCIFLYKTVTGRYPIGFNFDRSIGSDKPYIIHFHSLYVRLCKSLHKKFDNCKGDKFLTVCHDTGKIFFNPITCPVSVGNEALFVELVVHNHFTGYHRQNL